jgi:hypothetical protein
MRVELGVAIVSGAIAIGSAVVAYWAKTSVAEIESERSTALENLAEQHERQRPFLERQMSHYFEAAEIAAKIANSEDAQTRTAAVDRFWLLYWGPLAVVEDAPVERAMVAFGNALRSDVKDRRALQRLSLNLAHACRQSLEKLWGADLGKLENLRR